MHRRKSSRHVRAANARWRVAEARAEAEREAGIADIPLPADTRQPLDLDLRSWGGPLVRIEPRAGYIAGRAIDVEAGQMIECAALKTLLRTIARRLPRTLSPKCCHG
jgi:hypothetical protein